MRKLLFLAAFLLGAINSFAQTQNIKHYQGEEYMPYIFEPYSAAYRVNFGIFGAANVNLNEIFATVVESRDRWSETQKILMLNAEIGRQENEIDLKNGLTRRHISTISGEDSLGKVEMSIDGDKVTIHRRITDSKGKIKRDDKYDLTVKEKLYPCNSVTFYSYLPLNDNFSGSFNCFYVDAVGKSSNQVLSIQKLTISVVKEETIAAASGTFECYKLATNTENIGFYDEKGIFQIFPENKRQMKSSNATFGFGNAFIWIDKKSRQMIRSEIRHKTGSGVNIELMKDKTLW